MGIEKWPCTKCRTPCKAEIHYDGKAGSTPLRSRCILSAPTPITDRKRVAEVKAPDGCGGHSTTEAIRMDGDLVMGPTETLENNQWRETENTTINALLAIKVEVERLKQEVLVLIDKSTRK